jgi:hypothetical protein
MPTDLPPDFHGTGKPRSTPNPQIPTRVNIPELETQTHKAEPTEDDLPGWAKALALVVMVLGSWALVVGVSWVVKHFFEFAAHLAF